MSNTAAHLVDHVIAPDLTLRQWVLTVPFELRLLLAAKPEALSAIGRIFVQEIRRWQREHARALGYEQPETAAVSFCQRFGSSLNLNIHWHVIVPDAVFLPDASGERVDIWASHSQWRSRVVTVASAKKKRVCATSTVTDPHATPVTPAGSDIHASGTAVSTPTRDGAQATSVSHPSSPKPQLPSAAALPRAEEEPLAPSHPAGEELRFRGLSRLAWATLYQRVFDIDPLDCSSCGGRMRFVEVIEDVVRARSELRRRNQPEQPPPLSRARSPDWVD